MDASFLFRPAVEADLDAVSALYRACAAHGQAAGSSHWSEDYPDRQEAREDLSQKGLFVLEQDGQIVSAITLLSRDDLDALPCWTPAKACSLTRLCVLPRLQGRHIGQYMMKMATQEAKARGYTATRHLSHQQNAASNRLYQRMGYDNRGEASLYDLPFWCFELLL